MSAERLMVAFAGTTLPEDVARALGARPYAGVTLFRHANVQSAAQVRALTAAAFATMVVPLIVFLALQRAFIRGILAGSVK